LVLASVGCDVGMAGIAITEDRGEEFADPAAEKTKLEGLDGVLKLNSESSSVLDVRKAEASESGVAR
jgi:hypothetical protein